MSLARYDQWKSKDGTVRRFSEMEDSHINNSIKYIERNYKQAIALQVMRVKANGYYTQHAKVEDVPGYRELISEKKRRNI